MLSAQDLREKVGDCIWTEQVADGPIPAAVREQDMFPKMELVRIICLFYELSSIKFLELDKDVQSLSFLVANKWVYHYI